MIEDHKPEENMLVQINSENKFIGSLMWKVADFLTFGMLENKKKPVESSSNKGQANNQTDKIK